MSSSKFFRESMGKQPHSKGLPDGHPLANRLNAQTVTDESNGKDFERESGKKKWEPQYEGTVYIDSPGDGEQLSDGLPPGHSFVGTVVAQGTKNNRGSERD